MSIKYKIPLIMLIALSINIVLLVGYYRLSLYSRVEQYQANMQQAITTAVEDVAKHINGNGLTAACQYLEGYTNPNNFTFLLTDIANDRVYAFGAAEKSALGFTQSEIVHLADGAYILQIQKHILPFNFTAHDIFRDLLTFEIIVLFIVFILLGGVMHFRYVRSLLLLSKTVSGYKSGAVWNIKLQRKDEIGRLAESFFSLSQKLYEEKQTQNRIIASISHDIKTPLTSVLGYSERLLKKEIDRTRLQRYLARIQESAKDIASVVDEFDDYLGTVIPEGLKMQTYTVAYICQMLKDEYESKIRESGGDLSVQNFCGNDDTIRIDLLGFRRVCANIIGNSIRHAGTEKLVVKLTMGKRGEQIFLRLSDNGSGVNEGELDYIFEPFYTSDKSRKLSGLGLAICKQIVEAMNGNIAASITAEKGLSIEIAFV